MSDLTLSIVRKALSDRSVVYDVEIHQGDQTITLACYGKAEADQLATTLAGVIEACACHDTVVVERQKVS